MTNRDWVGNSKATFTTLGASSHSEHERPEHDYYATEPKAAELLLELEPDLENIWECACGEGHMAEVFRKADKLFLATDIVDRNYCLQASTVDFLNTELLGLGDIVTNPPYKYAQEFVQEALAKVDEGRKVCMFLKVTFLEGKARKKLFEKNPPKTVYVSSSRLSCARNGEFHKFKSSAAAYAWFVWEKGYNGETTVKWFN